MNIAIAHSNPDVLRLFSRLISDLGYQVVWTSQTISQTESEYNLNKPDLLLLQLELSDKSSCDFIHKVMPTNPTTIIVTTDSVTDNTAAVFEAMSAGALDAFSEPSSQQPDSFQELKLKISNIKKLHDSMHTKTRPVTKTSETPLVAIGSSTGGPAALLTILKSLPPRPEAVFVIIQHMDDQFSHGMAKWLDDHCEMNISIAEHGQRPEVGHVYMAGTNDHLIINQQGLFEYTETPVEYPYRPSVNAFFESAVTHWPHKLIGVLLTGMGRDGADGLLSFYNRGMLTIAQDEKSCAVYGMPRAASELNAVTYELDINLIAKKIIANL